MSTKVTFVNETGKDIIVLVFWGPTDGFCIDKPYRKHFTLLSGDNDGVVDVGNDPICYCWNPVNDGVPKEECAHQQAKPGDTVTLP